MSWVAIGVAVILAGALSSLWLRNRPRMGGSLFQVLVGAGCGIGTMASVLVLVGHPMGPSSWTGYWAPTLDGLSAWFLVIALPVSAATAVYGVPYLSRHPNHRRRAMAHALLALLVAAMAGVVTARAVVPFLFAWEVMAVTAFLLVVFDSQDAEVRRAGFIYLILTHLSTLALVAMFAAMSPVGSDLTFEAIARDLPHLPGGSSLVLLLALIGFGLKAGVVPLHFWLPGAHAAAPSHVSALLSGVMIKMGIYGLLRVIMLVGTPPVWWGWLVFGLGLASGVLGVLWALAQHDLKRLLAYHSVENIGIILLGMGTGILGLSYSHPVVALLGFTGALLHSLNHALFKSLLFLGAGIVAQATRTRVIDRMGGLARRLPLTATAFLLGSAAIVGLPPLNGFVSEWVVFGAILQTGAEKDAIRIAIIGAPGLALIGGLALACFTKIDGVMFLGHPRSNLPLQANDPSWNTLLPLIGLAVGCLFIGLLPAIVLRPGMQVASLLTGDVVPAELAQSIGDGAGRISALMLTLILATVLVLQFRKRTLRRSAASVSDTWACGLPSPSRAQYTASSYAAMLLTSFQPMSGVHESRAGAGYFSHPFDLVLDGIVLPIWRRLGGVSRQMKTIQRGRIRWYLLSVILTLIFLLMRIALRQETP